MNKQYYFLAVRWSAIGELYEVAGTTMDIDRIDAAIEKLYGVLYMKNFTVTITDEEKFSLFLLEHSDKIITFEPDEE